MPPSTRSYIGAQGARTVFRVECSRCDEVFVHPRPVNVKDYGDSGESFLKRSLSRALDHAGWVCRDFNWRKAKCPQCAAPKKGEAMTRTNGVAGAAANALEAAAVKLEAALVREPTIKERQAVAAALDERYDVDKARYRGDSSDEKLAAELKVPRKWVADIRALLYGPNDTNEAKGAVASAAAELRKEFEAVQNDFIERMGKIEGRLRQLEGRL